MQFITVGKEVFRAARQGWQLEAAGSSDPKVAERLRKIKLVETLRKAKKDWKEIQELVGISRNTYYSWKKRLEREGLKGIQPRSRRPRRLRRKVHWTPELLERVENLRSRSRGSVPCERGQLPARERRGKARRKVRRPYATRKPRDYEVKEPGDLVQGDTLTVTLGPGEVIKQLNVAPMGLTSAVDLVSRFSFARVHSRATASLAAGFLRELVCQAPFPIRAVQVDGGSEFMAEFEEACARLGIKLFVLPPRSPKLNGHGDVSFGKHGGGCSGNWSGTWTTTMAGGLTWPLSTGFAGPHKRLHWGDWRLWSFWPL